jgi:hypothetical protein
MNREPTQVKASPMRAALGGISLLLLVALALQASPGFTERAEPARHAQGPVLRMIAQAVTRRAERQVQRQDEQPAASHAYPAVTPHRSDRVAITAPDLKVVTRPLGHWLTDRPPPARA